MKYLVYILLVIEHYRILIKLDKNENNLNTKNIYEIKRNHWSGTKKINYGTSKTYFVITNFRYEVKIMCFVI